MPTIKIRGAAAGAFAAFLFFAGPAFAAASINLDNPAFAPITGPTSIPVGHAEFCASHRSECGVNPGMIEAQTLSEASWQQLVDVNNDFNATIIPETDKDLYHVAEFWTYPNGAGDCEDIALAKRRQLIEDGWNPSTLLMTVVRETNGNGHAVLMVRTDRGDLVLDNQDGRVLLWDATPYEFIKRQSQADAGKWVGIRDDHMMIIAAAN